MKNDDEVMYPDNGQVELLSKEVLLIFLVYGTIVFSGVSSLADSLLGEWLCACLGGLVCLAYVLLLIISGIPKTLLSIGLCSAAYFVWALNSVYSLNNF